MSSAENKEKGDETKYICQIMQYTCSDYAIRIFFTVMNRHSNAKAVVFVNDPYDITDLVKGEEHLRRYCINWSKIFTGEA